MPECQRCNREVPCLIHVQAANLPFDPSSGKPPLSEQLWCIRCIVELGAS